MKKWIAGVLLSVICIVCLAAASAETSFAITETGRNEWTLFKNTGTMSRYTLFNALFNATGLDESKSMTLSQVSAPFAIETYSPEYYGVNFDGWQTDFDGRDFYGSVMFGISDDVLQALECKDYTFTFTISHNASSAKLSGLIHVVDAMPKTPGSMTGVEESYTIRPDETITVAPVLNPSGWAGTYETRMNFFVGKGNGGGYSTILEDGTRALIMGDGGENLVLYTFDSDSMTVTGKVPGYYNISVTIFVPYTNAYYSLRIPLTVLKADGSVPINRPMASCNIDNEMYSDENSAYFYEITRYKTDINMGVYCFMNDDENTGVLNDLVASEGAMAATGKAVFTGSDGKKYEYGISGYEPYIESGEPLTMLSFYGTLDISDLPAGDYQGTITLKWYDAEMITEVLLHRGYNASGDPTGVSGIKKLYVLHIGDEITFPMAVEPSGWNAPQPIKWYSNVTSQKDWSNTSVYYADDSWEINQGPYFTCRRTESASGVTDIYTAKGSGFYSCSISMDCADYYVNSMGYVMVLNEDGSIPDGGLQKYTADNISTIKIPEGTVKIESEAFANTPDNAIVFIPDTVSEIAQDAFSGVDGLIVIGYRNSAAQTFAQLNGYGFVPVEN